MDLHLGKFQSLGRSSLTAALAIAIWVGVTAMAFGLASWLEAVLASAMHLSWMQRLAG